MEAGYSFLPPGVVTQESYQNSIIRGIKTNSLPHPYEHRSCTVNTPTSYSQILLFYNVHRFGAHHADSHLRRRHFRRIYDLIHVCLMRRKLDLAARFLRVLIQSHEWNHDIEWRMGLLLVALSSQNGSSATPNAGYDSSTSSAKLKLLTALDLSSTFHFKATRLTEEMVVEYIASNKLVEAIELLESRVSVWPYKNQPSLHCYLGMLYLFVGVQKLLGTSQKSATLQSDTASKGVDLRKLDRNTRSKCRDCFTQVLYSTATWTTLELRRRQRIYYMYRKDLDKSENRPLLQSKRERIWGVDPLRDFPQDTAVVQDPHDEDVAQDDDPDQTIVQVTEDSRRSAEGNEEENEALEDADAVPRSGPTVWPKYWPEVEHVWSVEKPWAWHVAREYLDLLFPGNNYTSTSDATAADPRTPRNGDNTPAGPIDDSEIRHHFVESPQLETGPEERSRTPPIGSGSKVQLNPNPKAKSKHSRGREESSPDRKHKRKSRKEAEARNPAKKARMPVSTPAAGSSARIPSATAPISRAIPAAGESTNSRHQHARTRKAPVRAQALTPRGF